MLCCRGAQLGSPGQALTVLEPSSTQQRSVSACLVSGLMHAVGRPLNVNHADCAQTPFPYSQQGGMGGNGQLGQSGGPNPMLNGSGQAGVLSVDPHAQVRGFLWLAGVGGWVAGCACVYACVCVLQLCLFLSVWADCWQAGTTGPGARHFCTCPSHLAAVLPLPRRQPHPSPPPPPTHRHPQLQQMAGIPYGMPSPYGNGGMHSNMAFFGGGGVN